MEKAVGELGVQRLYAVAIFDRGQLDAVIVRRENGRRDGEILSQERVGWFAAPNFEQREGEPLRLASLAASCGVRNMATRALDAAGREWAEVFLGGGSAAVVAAVVAGLAVGAFAHCVVPIGLVDVGGRFGLPPPLPSSEIVLYSRLSDYRSGGALRILAAAFRQHRSPAA